MEMGSGVVRSNQAKTRLHELLEAVEEVMGAQGMRMVLHQSGLEKYAQNRVRHVGVTDYADFLSALRRYYGQGARGSLIRAGREMFKRRLRAQRVPWAIRLARIRLAPPPRRSELALEPLVKVVTLGLGQVHKQDDSLRLVDPSHYRTVGMKEEAPVCWTAVGEISAALLWGTGNDIRVVESECRASGAENCRFDLG